MSQGTTPKAISIQKITEALRRAPTETGMLVFNSDTQWKERCTTLYSFVENNKSNLARVVAFLARHSGEIKDPKLKNDLESKVFRYFGIHKNTNPRNSSEPAGFNVPESAVLEKRFHDVAWWIQGCGDNIKARKYLENKEAFQGEYAKALASIIEAVASGARKEPEEGQRILEILQTMIGKL